MRRARTSPWMLILTVTLFAGSCTQPAPPPPAPPKPDLAAEEQLIRAADRAWLKAAQAKDPAAEVAVLATGRDDRAAEQRADESRRVSGLPDEGLRRESENRAGLDHGHDPCRRFGRLGGANRSLHGSGLGPKGDGTDNGRFVTIWKKVSGSWKVASDTSVSTQPVADKK